MSELAQNPLYNHKGLPHFERIRIEHVEPAVLATLEDAEKRLQNLEAKRPTSWKDLFPKLWDISDLIHNCWSPVSHLNSVMNSDELRAVYERMQKKVVDFTLRLDQSEPVFQSLLSLKSSQEWGLLDTHQRRIVGKRILAAELGGARLDGAKRERFNEIVKEMSKQSVLFVNHVLDATKEFHLDLFDEQDVKGFPKSLRTICANLYQQAQSKDETADPDRGPWRVTLADAVFSPFIQNCEKRELRERVYRAYVTRASEGSHDNSQIIVKKLQLRKELANLLGYENYAQYSLAQKMVGTPNEVFEFLEELRERSWGVAKKELAQLQQFAKDSGCQNELMHWDIPFWAKRLEESLFDYTEEEIRQYFSLDRVLEGMFGLVNDLFEISVKEASQEVSLWHRDVRFFKIFDHNEQHIASFFLDPYSRPENKNPGAWMNDCQGRRYDQEEGATVRLPVAYLICNATPPVDDQPSLMTFREVETLFHEFGHGLQHMLTGIDHPDASGISGVEWDAVELPSQFMENWCYHEKTFMGMAKHYETGETMSRELFEKIKSAKNFRAASMMLRQLQFGILDMHLHARFDVKGEKSAFDVQKEVFAKTSLLAPLPEDRFLCGFSHIFAGGYAAGYYSYKWAEVLSADAFSAFEEQDLDARDEVAAVGKRFRETVLALGGAEPPLEVFKKFRGRAPSLEPLLRHSGLSE